MKFNADYFNNFLKCWEPCIGANKAELFLEKSTNRGIGMYFKTLSPIFFTVTSAFFVSINNILFVVEKNMTAACEETKTETETKLAI